MLPANLEKTYVLLAAIAIVTGLAVVWYPTLPPIR